MSLNRYAARRDANDLEIASEAIKMGWWLTMIRTPADYLGFLRGRWFPIEIKTAAGTYTRAQKLFQDEAQYRGAKVLTWRNLHDMCEDTRQVLK
jgi:hypothetical protein